MGKNKDENVKSKGSSSKRKVTKTGNSDKGSGNKVVDKNKNYRPKTVNMTPTLLKALFIYICIYCIYSMVFLFSWNILPYTFGYTLYVVDESYPEYDIEENDILLVKRINVSEDEEELQLHRVGKDYEITKGVRRPYGIVVSSDVVRDLANIFGKLKSIFVFWVERYLEWIPFSF